MRKDKIAIKAFVRERDAALRSLDKTKLTAYMDKYGVDWRPMNETVFWAAVHKARLSARSFTAEEKMVSAKWLAEHRFKAEGLNAEDIIKIYAQRGKS